MGRIQLTMSRLIVVVLVLVFTPARANLFAPPPVTDADLQQIAGTLEMFVDELPHMPKINGYTVGVDGTNNPKHLTIGMYQKKWKFHRDIPASNVFVYGTCRDSATFPGPTIEAIKGVTTYITWLNHLPLTHILPWDPTVPTATPTIGGVPTVVHLHGGVHEPASDGSAFAWFTNQFRERGSAWSRRTYTYTNVQHAGNLWYHDHALGLTRENLLAGLLGMYVIRDPALEAPLNLPSGEEFDRHLVIADRSFYSDGSIFMNSTGNVPYIHPQWQPEYFGEVMTVNGKAWPFLAVQRRRYRFRIINVSNARYLNLNFSNGLNFTVIGSDTSYLPAPIVTPTLLLSPAEIFDVIVDFNTTTTNETILQNDAHYPYPNGTAAGPLHQTIMKFSISPNQPITPDNSTIPTTLINYPTSLSPTLTRYITMYEYLTPSNQSTHLSINGLRLEDPATEIPVTGSTELWEVINLTGDDHPLHLHLAMFQATTTVALVDPDVFVACMNVSNDAVACNITGHATGNVTNVPEHEKAWKNVVKIAPMSMTTVIVKFNLVEGDKPYPFDATAKPDYVYHCHINAGTEIH
ncbi:hypothetical protein QJS10_CPA01g01443 [Acorus calamus]|uniref:Laccase n=1 Tax=Acorus calamus TaxID=4465 RepID=A0AAV9FIE1_ACOCL|nr:hypothetical protein QJS10_CPA01g01443 [Acorus calamus]